uniref:Uncharacterized protein n=1 Tax=Setaria digitata TaxID=48799 RepID=A0A915PG72_9BILA
MLDIKRFSYVEEKGCVLDKLCHFSEITEDDAVPSFDSIEVALNGGFQKEVFKELKMLVSGSRNSDLKHPEEESSVGGHVSDMNNTFLPVPADPVAILQKDKESNDFTAYPTSCRFCGGMLRAVNKHRDDQKLTLQCRRRTCMKFNGVTADKNAKHFLSEMAKPKAPQIDYGWYLSDPVKHAYGIFASDNDSSDSDVDKSSVDVRPIIQDGSIMLRVFGQKRLVRLL